VTLHLNTNYPTILRVFWILKLGFLALFPISNMLSTFSQKTTKNDTKNEITKAPKENFMVNPFNKDVIQYIFLFLGVSDWYSTMLVCSNWNKVTQIIKDLQQTNYFSGAEKHSILR
jgi:hypothetical protein